MYTINFIGLGLVLLGYLLGSISSAMIVAKIMHLPDPRIEGSGNPGATNILRLGGKKAAIWTLLGDVLKGVIPVMLARYLHASDLVLILAALAAFLGHLFPLYFAFKGGKGVATFLGVIFALSWIVGLIAIGIWLVIAIISRYSSLASIGMIIIIPFAAYFITAKIFILPLIFMSIIMLFKHRENIMRLVRGTESRIGAKKPNENA